MYCVLFEDNMKLTNYAEKAISCVFKQNYIIRVNIKYVNWNIKYTEISMFTIKIIHK